MKLDLRGFTEITVPGSWQVEVAHGPYAVQISVEDNVLDDVRVERRGDALRFGMRPGLFGRVTLRAQVSMPELGAIRVSGSGRVTFTGFSSPALALGVSGSGAVLGSQSQVGALEADVSGSGTST